MLLVAPHPWKYPPTGGGRMKEGGGYKNPAAGGVQNIYTPPFPLKMPSAHKWGEEGGGLMAHVPLLWPLSRYTVSRTQCRSKFLLFLRCRRDVALHPPRAPQTNLSHLWKGEKTPTPKISALLRKRPVLRRANFVLTKDRKRPYYGNFCGKIHREGSCSKAAGRP